MKPSEKSAQLNGDLSEGSQNEEQPSAANTRSLGGMSARPDGSRAGVLVAATVAGVVLTPYATLTLEFRAALIVQALTISSITLFAVIMGMWRGRGLGEVTRPASLVDFGVSLYAAVALTGLIVAMVLGNDLVLAGGQFLSMGLLPAGFLAGVTLHQPFFARRFSWSLVGTTSLIAMLHFAVAGNMIARGQPVSRLYLEDSVSISGPSLLAMLLALALVNASPARHRNIAVAATLIIGGIILASGTRSLWVASTIGLVAYPVCLGSTPWSSQRRLVLATGGTVLLIASGVVGLWVWSLAPRENSFGPILGPRWRTPPPGTTVVEGMPNAPEGPTIGWDGTQRSYVLTERVPTPAGAGYRWRFSVQGSGRGLGQVALYWHDAGGRLQQVVGISRTATLGWEQVERVVTAPAGAASCSLVVGTDTKAAGHWYINSVRLERLRPAFFGRLWGEARFSGRRFVSLLTIPFGHSLKRDPSLGVRVAESRATLDLVREGSVWKKLFGHGLGAVYSISEVPGASTRILEFERRNYIHNYYAFLLFKVGIIGTAAVLAALGFWLVRAWCLSRRSESAAEKACFAGLFAAWLSYIVWSVFCPEILDFRMAPIWGLTLASMANAENRVTLALSERKGSSPRVLPTRR